MADIYTSTGVFSPAIPAEYITDQALDALQANGRIVPHVAQYDLGSVQSKSFSIPILGTVAPSTIGETADLASTAWTPTEQSITPAEVGVMTLLTDFTGQVSAVRGLEDQYARNVALGFARKFDTDLGALFSALNGGTLLGGAASGAGSTMTKSLFLRGIYNLELNNVMGGLVAFFSPLAVNSLRTAIATTAAVVNSRIHLGKANDDGFVDNIFGVDTYMVNTLTTASATTGSKYGAMMGRGQDMCPIAIAFWRQLRGELQRDASRRGDELNWTSIYGVKEIRDLGGIGYCVI